MRMNDGLHSGTLAIDPDVEAHAWIRPPAGERLQILVDEHHPLGARFFEAVAELKRPPAVVILPRGDLSGETRLMAFMREDAARTGERCARRQVGRREVGRHLAA